MEVPTFHETAITDVNHLGFDRETFLRWLREAGFTNVSATTAFVHQRNGREYPVFLAVADA